jgi:uncharacterized protein (DUF736 family)
MKIMENNERTKLEEAGAFWMKSSKTGTQFLTGKIKSKSGEETNVIVFKNKYKTEGSNQPDYRVYFDNGPKNNLEVPVSNAAETKTASDTKTELKTEPKSELKSEEIPF